MNEEELRRLVQEGFKQNIIFPDGHGLFPAEKYMKVFNVFEMGLVRTFVSDGTPKGTIFQNGEPVESLSNVVYNLTFLECLAELAGIPQSKMLGRGFAAQDLCDRLELWANLKESSESSV